MRRYRPGAAPLPAGATWRRCRRGRWSRTNSSTLIQPQKTRETKRAARYSHGNATTKTRRDENIFVFVLSCHRGYALTSERRSPGSQVEKKLLVAGGAGDGGGRHGD